MTAVGDAVKGEVYRLRAWLSAHPATVTVACTGAVAAALAVGLSGERNEFAAALSAASWEVLAGAVGLQLIWLVARSEGWFVCVGAAGGAVERRRLYRASAVGYLGSVISGQLAIAVRIAALRRSAPADTPRVGVLVAAEMPVVVIELGLAALCSFTLIGPLGVPWWVPLVALAVAAAVLLAAVRCAERRGEGLWAGLGALAGLRSRNRIVAITILAVSLQVARNWLVLRGLGAEISVLDSVALLIGTAVVGLLPVGPTLGAATAVLILGANGVAVTAAAGALLTATGAVGACLFAAWALADRLREVLAPTPDSVPVS